MPSRFLCSSLKCLVVAGTVGLMAMANAQLGSAEDPIKSVTPAQWIGNRQPSIGTPTAAIRIVCFLDYQCTHCREADPIVRAAVAKHPNMALYYRQFPITTHIFAPRAAAVAENARLRGTYEIAHKRMMQGKELSAAAIDDAAKKAGVSAFETPQSTVVLDDDKNLEHRTHMNYLPGYIVIENGKCTLMNESQMKKFLKSK